MNDDPSPAGHVPSWELPTVSASQPPVPPPVVPPAPAHSRQEPPAERSEEFLPVSGTLRLYAGWLLAWYACVYLLGSLRQAGLAPWVPAFVENLFQSPLTLHFTFATFLFLLGGTVHRRLGGGALKGLVLLLAGCALLYGFWLYA